MVELIGADSTKLLSIRSFSARFGEKIILADINLDLKVKGVTHLFGPCGAGKSTLLRSIAGLNEQSSIYRSQGEVLYKGEELGTLDYPPLLEQKPSSLLKNIFDSIIDNVPERASLSPPQQTELVNRLLNAYGVKALCLKLGTPLTELSLCERRIVLILGLIATAPELVMLDEPTADLNKADAKLMLNFLGKISENRAVLIVQHNQQQALDMGGEALLLAGGVIHEAAATQQLLQDPQSAAGKEFVGSGTCAVPSPNTDPAFLDEAFVNKYMPVNSASNTRPEVIPFGPRGFRWIEDKRLAATQRPGLLQDLIFDLKALRKVNIGWLISLEEEVLFSEELASEYGIQIRHLPIADMQPPTREEAKTIAAEISLLLKSGERVAVHCKAGLGRTGTVLASYYVYSEGLGAQEAIQKIRCVDPRMIQSQEQEKFIFSLFK